MASTIVTLTLAAGLSGPVTLQSDLHEFDDARPVFVAADCSSAASKVIRETGGKLLSVEVSGDGQSCIVTVLVQGNGERPRKVTKRVGM